MNAVATPCSRASEQAGGDELATVVGAQHLRPTVLREETLELRDDVALPQARLPALATRTGYKGRVGIFQLLEMTEELASLAAKHASRDEIEREAMAGGCRTLWDDGIAKASAGLTSIEELARVTIQRRDLQPGCCASWLLAFQVLRSRRISSPIAASPSAWPRYASQSHSSSQW
jgi:hypothetical protein